MIEFNSPPCRLASSPDLLRWLQRARRLPPGKWTQAWRIWSRPAVPRRLRVPAGRGPNRSATAFERFRLRFPLPHHDLSGVIGDCTI